MNLQIVKPQPEHIPELARIFFIAFEDILHRYHLPNDIPNLQVATQAMTMFVTNPDYVGLVALLDGKIVGSNFTTLFDSVAGVGPITVDPTVQAQGIGHALMQGIIDHARQNHGPHIRLVQDAINMVSLSLYTKLGYAVQEPLVLLTYAPASTNDPTIRPMTSTDLDTCDNLYQQVHGISRRREIDFHLHHGSHMGTTPFVRQIGQQLTGYLVPGFFGHGVASTNADLWALHHHAPKQLPPHAARFLCPTRNAELYRLALHSGARAVRGLHLMSIGPYQSKNPNQTPWNPSIAY